MRVVVGLCRGPDIDGRPSYLIQRRAAKDLRGGLYEFPGGKVESGEDDATALRREWMEELGVEIAVGPKVTSCVIDFPDAPGVVLPLYEVALLGGEPIAQLGQEDVRYATLGTILSLPTVPTMARYAMFLPPMQPTRAILSEAKAKDLMDAVFPAMESMVESQSILGVLKSSITDRTPLRISRGGERIFEGLAGDIAWSTATIDDEPGFALELLPTRDV